MIFGTRAYTAKRVGDGDVAGAVCIDQAGDPDQGLLTPEDRIQPIVVEPPVDDVDRFEAARGPHEDVVQVDDQVGALHQLDPHLLGQVQVLVVGGIVDSGREEDDRRVVDALGSQPPKVAKQLVNVAFDRPDRVAGEEIGQDSLHDVSVGQHVGDA